MKKTPVILTLCLLIFGFLQGPALGAGTLELDSDHNGAVDMVYGGTNATTAAGARATLDAQQHDADLDDLADGVLSKTKVEDSASWDAAHAWGDHAVAGYLRTVNTIADLRLLTPGPTATSAKVLGYNFAGDGGAGPVRTGVYGAAPGTYVDNGGSIIVPTGGDGSAAWTCKFTGGISVRYFGAWGDGLHADHLAINSAIAYAKTLLSPQERSATGKGAVVQLDGNHYITAPINLTGIRAAFEFIFDGNGASIYANTPGKQAVDAMGAKRIIFRDFTVWSDKAANVYWGMTIGRKVTGEVADDHRFYNIAMQGYYTKACLYNLASEQTIFFGCQFFNDNDVVDTAYSMINDSYNSFGVTSDYIDLSGLSVNTTNSFNANQYYGCRFNRRNFDGGNKVCVAIWMDQNCQKHVYQSCYVVAAKQAAVVIKFRDLATGGWAEMQGLYMDIHIEAYNHSVTPLGLVYGVQVLSDSGTAAAVIRDFTFKDNNPHVSSAIFSAAVGQVESLSFSNCDIDITQSSVGAPKLGLPQGNINYIGRITIPAEMGTQSFIGSYGDISLIIPNATHALVNDIITAATVPVRIYDKENKWVAGKTDWPTEADLGSIVSGSTYTDTTAGNVLKIKP